LIIQDGSSSARSAAGWGDSPAACSFSLASPQPWSRSRPVVFLGDVVNSLQAQPEELFEAGFPLREIEAAFFVSTFIAIIGLRTGRRLVRGRRSVVLFLRRFGYDGAMQVVTYAVAQTIGTSWRLVTLDDDEIAPVGVDTTSRIVIGTGERLTSLAIRVGQGVMVGFQWSIGGMWAVVALQLLVAAPDLRQLLEDGTADRYAAIFGSVMKGRFPIEYLEPSLAGAFALLLTGVALGLAGLVVIMVTLLAMLPLFGFVMFATSSAEALHQAEQNKTATLSQPADVARIASELPRRGSQTFAPRLIVVRVATSIWQQAVGALARVAAATIIDISEPTDNLAWEIQELDRLDIEDRCIFIVDHARLAENSTLGADAGFQSTLAKAVGDREVLAYTTDRAGMRRFARALHGRLLDLPARSAGSN
jgi:hypothetical protein